MGKAKKGNKKKGPTRMGQKRLVVDLGASLERAKKYKSDIRAQISLVCIIMKIYKIDPDVFRLSNYRTEVPITLLVALGKNRNDREFKQNASIALYCLIRSPYCIVAVFKFGGSKYLLEIAEEYLGAESVVEVAIEDLSNLHYYWGDIPPKESPYDILGKAGCHKTIIKVLKRYPRKSKITNGCRQILSSLIEFCQDENRKHTLMTDIVAELLVAIDGSQIALVAASCFCQVLTNMIGKNRSLISFLKDANGPSRVIAMMEHHPDKPEIQASGCWFLSRLIDDEGIPSKPCFDAVMSALKKFSDDPDTRRGGMAFMRSILLATSGSRSKAALEWGHLAFFLEMMGQYKEFEVQAVGCMVVGLLTKTNEPMPEEVAVHYLGGALKLSPTEPMEKTFLWGVGIGALALVVRGDEDRVVDALLQDNIYAEIISALERTRDHYTFKLDDSNVCTILRMMATTNRNDKKLEIATLGGIDLIVDCMKKNPANKVIQTLACQTLGLVTINKDPQIFDAISKVDGVNIILDAIERFPEDKDIFNFGGSAALLTREYEDDKKYGKLAN